MHSHPDSCKHRGTPGSTQGTSCNATHSRTNRNPSAQRGHGLCPALTAIPMSLSPPSIREQICQGRSGPPRHRCSDSPQPDHMPPKSVRCLGGRLTPFAQNAMRLPAHRLQRGNFDASDHATHHAQESHNVGAALPPRSRHPHKRRKGARRLISNPVSLPIGLTDAMPRRALVHRHQAHPWEACRQAPPELPVRSLKEPGGCGPHTSARKNTCSLRRYASTHARARPNR